MRKALQIGQVLNLSGNTKKRTVKIELLLGEGANSYAYLVSEGGLYYVLKECFPSKGAVRLPDNSISWENDAVKSAAFDRVKMAFNIQATLLSGVETVGSNVHLADSLLHTNNTIYSLTQNEFMSSYDHIIYGSESLQDIFTRALYTAKALYGYHKLGYLHLDLKPQNILVDKNDRNRIFFLDFDSVVKESEISPATISYSCNYAAPELLQWNIKKICKATDIYSLGAIIFSRIFNRVPESKDRNAFSNWDLDSIQLFKGLSNKTKILCKELFKHTLCASPQLRYQGCDELINILESLCKESDPTNRFLLTTAPNPVNIFIGREKELSDIDRIFSYSDPCIVSLHGIGGIGKTSIAINYAAKYKGKYSTVCYGRYNTSLIDLFNNGTSIRANIDNNDDGFKTILELADDNTLLIIDGFDTLFDPDIEKLFTLPCKILITSRCNLKKQYPVINQIDIAELPESEQVKLFISCSEGACSAEDNDAIASLCRRFEGYTLLIPLVSNVLANGYLTLSELSSEIASAGIYGIPDDSVDLWKDNPISDTVLNILRKVFDITEFSSMEETIMQCFSFFDGMQVERKQLLSWFGTEYNNSINSLAKSGWLISSGAGLDTTFEVHTVISQLLQPVEAYTPAFLEWCRNRFKEYKSKCTELMILDAKNQNIFNTLYWTHSYFFSWENKIQVEKLNQLSERQINLSWGILYRILESASKTITSLKHLVDYLVELTSLDLTLTVNFTPSIYYILIAHENTPYFQDLSSERKCCFYYLKFLSSISNLIPENGCNSRNPEYVRFLVKDIISCANCVINYSKTNEINLPETTPLSRISSIQSENTTADVFFNILSAPLTFGQDLFITEEMQYDEQSLSVYRRYLVLLSKKILFNPSFSLSDNLNEYITVSLTTAVTNMRYTLEEVEHFASQGGMTDEEWEDFWKDYDASGVKQPFDADSPEEEIQRLHIEELRMRADTLLQKCIDMGYGPQNEILENLSYCAIQHDTKNISEASEILKEARKAYIELHRYKKEIYKMGLLYKESCNGVPLKWFDVNTILQCCKEDYESAIESYREAISIQIGDLSPWWYNEKPVYNAVVSLGFIDFSNLLLKENITLLEKEYNTDKKDDNQKYQILQRLLTFSQLLGDNKLCTKYDKLIKQLTNVGYSFK